MRNRQNGWMLLFQRAQGIRFTWHKLVSIRKKPTTEVQSRTSMRQSLEVVQLVWDLIHLPRAKLTLLRSGRRRNLMKTSYSKMMKIISTLRRSRDTPWQGTWANWKSTLPQTLLKCSERTKLLKFRVLSMTMNLWILKLTSKLTRINTDKSRSKFSTEVNLIRRPMLDQFLRI